jgi:hypothetical protein
MSKPVAFYYEDYDTKSDPEYLYHKDDADEEFRRLGGQVQTLVKAMRRIVEDDNHESFAYRVAREALREVGRQ